MRLSDDARCLRSHEAPVDFCLYLTNPLRVFVAEAIADAALAITDTNDAGWMMYAVDDDIARFSHGAAGDYRHTVERLPAKSIAGFHERVVRRG